MSNQVHNSSGPIEVHSPRQILIEWANSHDAWARHLASEVIRSGSSPTSALLDEAYALFKAEKGLSPGEAVDVPSLPEDEQTDVVAEELHLTTLHSIKGVNALIEGMKISFNPGLTILFGENGAGKTGYVRVIKRAAGVRTAEDILGNANALESQPEPSAVIGYTLSGEPGVVEWHNDLGVPPLTWINVFDHRAVLLHVDDELNYVYTPADLALFKYVASGISGVQERAASEARELRPSGNPFVSRFARGTPIYPLVEGLGPTTDFVQLEELAVIPEDAEALRGQLHAEIAALKGNSLDDRLAGARERRQSLSGLRMLLSTCASFARDAYEVARKAEERSEAELRRARSELFAPGELLGEPDDEWHEFVSAAEHYRAHLGRDDYPAASEPCLYCGQKLTDTARQLIEKYRAFLDDSLARQAVAARKAFEAIIPAPLSAEFTAALSFLDRLAEAENRPLWLSECRDVLAECQKTMGEASSRKPLARSRPLAALPNVLAQVEGLEKELALKIAELEKQTSDRSSALAQRQQKLRDLEARIELVRQLDSMKTFVANAKGSQRLEQFSKNASQRTLRSLTEASKVASEELVNRNFERLFTEECDALHAPKVKLEFHGRSGGAERRKMVAAGYRPSAILSEGEIKVLAIADFIAECRLREGCAPILFDDPVTSLDYRRQREVAERLAELVSTHQVIVFTHNLLFTTGLLALFEKRKKECSFYTVRDNEDAKGIISSESGPRVDTPREIGKKIRAVIESARKAEPAVAEALAEKGYEHIRSWCEAFVEQELLQGVTQRYQPNVMMTKLSSIKPEAIPKAQAVIGPIFDKACRYMAGHSQPIESLNVRPSIAELEQDFSTLEAMRTDYLKPPKGQDAL